MATDPWQLKWLNDLLSRQQSLLEALSPAREYHRQMEKYSTFLALAQSAQSLERMIGTSTLPRHILDELNLIRSALAAGRINEMLLHDIRYLRNELWFSPEIRTPEITRLLDDLQHQAALVARSPLTDILQSAEGVEAFQRRVESLYPRYILEPTQSLDDEEQLTVRDTQDPSGQRHVHVDVLPGILSVQEVLKEISPQDAMDFYQHLANYPMLGLCHDVGKGILEGLKCIDWSTLDKGLRLFRGRQRCQKRAPFTEPEMFAPPAEKACQGRANPEGSSYLYTCDCPEGAIAEVDKGSGRVVDVIEWQLSQAVRVLDLTEVDAPLIRFCYFRSEQAALNPAYLIPNFLAQCSASVGIPAMRFKSVKYSGATSCVFFSYDRSWFHRVEFHEGASVNEE